MTVSSETTKAGPYIGDGAATGFPFAYKVFEKSDVLVVQQVIATGVNSTLVLDSDYSVTLNLDQDTNPGGTVNYPLVGSPMPATESLTLGSIIPRTQPTDLPNGGAFFAQAIENMVDRAIRIEQQTADLGSRSLHFPITDTNSGELPSVVQRLSKYMAFDSVGDPIAVSGDPAQIAIDIGDTINAANGDALVGVKYSATGSAARTQHEKNADIVSALDFIGSDLSVVARAALVAAIKAKTTTTNVTAYAQAALDSGRDVYFPSGKYVIDIDRVTDNSAYAYGLTASSNQRIYLDRDANFESNQGTLTWGAILAVFDKSDVEIVGGKWKGDRSLTPSGAGYHHNIDIRASTRVTVRDVYSYDAYGDGIYVGKGPVSGNKCSYVTLINATAYNSYRNNLSVVYCDHFRDYGGSFVGANGASPEGGVDCEPDGTDEQDDLSFYGSRFISNLGSGIDSLRSHNVRCVDCSSIGNKIGARVAGNAPAILEADLTWIGGEIKDNTQQSLSLTNDNCWMTVDGAHITGTPSSSHIQTTGLTGTSRRFTLRNSVLELAGVASFFSWTNADITSTWRVENNDFIVSAAIEPDTLRGGSVMYRGNRYFLRTGYTNANNGGALLSNVPFVSYDDCEFWNDTANSCTVGAASVMSRRHNSFFDEDVQFVGYLSDKQLSKNMVGIDTVGTGEDDLRSYIAPADSLGKSGGLKFFAAGTKTGAGGNKTLKFYVGATAYTFHAAANNTNDWKFEASVFGADSATVVRISYVGWDGTTIVQDHMVNQALATTAAQTFKITGECANGADVINQSIWVVDQL